MSQVLGLITARGGSKSIPRKNIRPLAGKPVIAWTIDAALQSRTLDRVVVSTDDEEIAQVARECGAAVPFMRPAELACDDTPHIEVVRHALQRLESGEEYRPDYVVLLQPTSPLRTSDDIDAAVEVSEKNGSDAVVSVCLTHHHPFLVKRIDEDGNLEDFLPSPLAYERRQDLPPAYFINGAIYLTRRRVLLDEHTFLPHRTLPYIMPGERSPQIDDLSDFRVIEFILREYVEASHD